MGTVTPSHAGCDVAKVLRSVTSASGAGVGGARQLEVSLKGIGQAQAELQTVWVKIAPNTSWYASLRCLVHQPAMTL